VQCEHNRYTILYMPDDGTEEVSKHVADCVSIVFTFHCKFDKQKDV